MIPKPTNLPAAIRYLRQQGLMPTSMTSAQLQQLDANITERSFFAAQLDRTDVLQQGKDLIGRMADPSSQAPGQHINPATFRKEMRGLLKNIGYEINPDGKLTDITSSKRLNLIATMNASEARGYAQFEQANNKAVIDAFPCQELFRLHYRKVPRQWLRKWVDAGGQLYQGRMIAMKDDPIWAKTIDSGGFNRFGRPWPPYDFNSGMWIKPVPRGTARRLGVIQKDETPKRQVRHYNENHQQSCTPLSPELKRYMDIQFENRFRIDEQGTVHFLSVTQGVQKAMKDFDPNRNQPNHVFLSNAQATLIQTITSKVGPLKNNPVVSADATHLYHIAKKHGPDKYPITDADVDKLPAILMDPNPEIKKSTKTHKNEDRRARIRLGEYDLVLENQHGNLGLITFYKWMNYEK